MIAHYLSFALRSLARDRFSTLVSIAGLALGIASFAGAWTFASYIENADRHFAKSERIYALYQRTIVEEMGLELPFMTDTSPLAADRLEAEFPRLEQVARSRSESRAAVTVGAEHSFRRVNFVEPGFLRIFDFSFVAGSPGRARALTRGAILTEPTAEALFGHTTIVGESLHLAGIGDVEIAGVISDVPRPSHFGPTIYDDARVEVFVVTRLIDDIEGPMRRINDRRMQWFGFPGPVSTYLLLPADGSVTAQQINARLPALLDEYAPVDASEVRFEIRNISELVGDELDSLLWRSFRLSITDLLLALGALVLATACLNFVNLATARGVMRAKEAGLRKALGARRGALLRQHLIEGVLTAALAVPIAVALLELGIRALNEASSLTLDAPSSAGVGFWAFLLTLTVLVGAAAAAYPALGLARVPPVAALRAGTARAGRGRLRRWLIGLQFAAASFLVIALNVAALQNAEIRRSAFSIETDPLVVVTTGLQEVGVDSETFRAELSASPHIESVTGTASVPWAFEAGGTGYTRTPDDPNSYQFTQQHRVSYDYFSTFGLEVLAGRTFSRERDAGMAEQQAPRIIIDRVAAERFGWSEPEAAVGQVLYATTFSNNEHVPITIIGVVEHAPRRIISWGERAFVYTLSPEIVQPIVAVSRDQVTDALAHIDAVWRKLAPEYPTSREFVDARFASAYRLFSGVSRGFAILASFAFAIAVTGLLGMVYFVAARRRHEMGVRKVLGASPKRIFALLLGDFMRPIVIANLAVWPLGYLAARTYVNLFMQPAALTPLPFVLSLVVTVLVAGGVVAHHAFRAARLRPADVLRHE